MLWVTPMEGSERKVIEQEDTKRRDTTHEIGAKREERREKKSKRGDEGEGQGK